MALPTGIVEREMGRFTEAPDGGTAVKTFSGDAVGKKIVNVASATVTYEGLAAHGSLTSVAVWQIKRIAVSGLQTITEYADSGRFTQIWDNRANLFGAIPFANAYSLQFDGVNDHVTIPDNAALSFDRLTPFTCSLWFKSSNTSAIQCFITKQSGGNLGYRICMNANGSIEYELRNALGNRILVVTNSTGHNDGSWKHVVVTYTGSSAASGVAIYVNGVAQALTINNDTLTLATTAAVPVILGANHTGTGQNLRGNLDEICLWDVALSAANVTTLYNSGTPIDLASGPSPAARREWWRMGDSATFPTIPGVVGSNNGTMTNMTAGDIESETPP